MNIKKLYILLLRFLFSWLVFWCWVLGIWWLVLISSGLVTGGRLVFVA